MTTIPRIPLRKYNSPEYRDLYQDAIDSNKVFMVILDKSVYSKIEFDIESIRPRVTLAGQTLEKIISMYKAYSETSKMDKRYFEYVGGDRNLTMTIKKKDSDWFAAKLYKLINDNLQIIKKQK
jgi:hypothetical protein